MGQIKRANDNLYDKPFVKNTPNMKIARRVAFFMYIIVHVGQNAGQWANKNSRKDTNRKIYRHTFFFVYTLISQYYNMQYETRQGQSCLLAVAGMGYADECLSGFFLILLSKFFINDKNGRQINVLPHIFVLKFSFALLISNWNSWNVIYNLH